MNRRLPALRIVVSDRPGIGLVEIDAPAHVVRLGEPLSPQASIALGLSGPRLTERTLALLTLMAFEWADQANATMQFRGPEAQRYRFARKLGMTPDGFSKFVQRTIHPRSVGIIRWDQLHSSEGPERSWSGGPWWLAVRDAKVEPGIATGRAFVERVRDKSIDRGRDPRELFRDALAARERGDWVEALGLFESLAERFRRRQWPRNDPFWFEVLLTLGGTQMQLGTRGLWPRVPKYIRVSISEQRLRGPEYALIAARAHYLAALIYNQAGESALTPRILRELRQCEQLLAGRRDPAALNEFWKAASYEEITRARRTGVFAPRVSSAILEAGRVVESQRYQNLMRYGETLLHGNRPAAGLDFIQSSLDSGKMELPGQIIGRRLEVLAKWKLGAKKQSVLETLDAIQTDARSYGFAHQVRSIAAAKSRVRLGIRSPLPE
jgi:hypothetical protein